MRNKSFFSQESFLKIFILIILLSALSYAGQSSVKVWQEDIVLPTYVVGPPDPNPMFYFGAASQGAEQRIYPYPLYDDLTGVKEDKTYKLVYLENEYIKIAIIPEIGGKIFEAIDKTNGYNFFYRQHVIKPALISLLGAWISGGVEWNIPHHHRATSFLPVQYKIEENDDGSKTVWVGELELRDRMRWAVGCTLRPGKSYLESSVRILNRTPFVNTILCFANPAVHVNENYQVIFPPSTQFGTYHSKREFTTWPIGSGRYNGANFNGVDISWYKNHQSSNSVFAWNYEDDFVAGYDHGAEAGTMAVSNHHIVPGKKFWTWGNNERGRMQDTILTDNDGPYIEIMVGAYSDNQPDYSWIQPYEVKSFKWYWYPFRDIGGAKNANLDAAVNLDVNDGTAHFGFYTTSTYDSAQVKFTAGDKILVNENISINPAKAYVNKVPVPADVDIHDLRASLSVDGKELVAYSPVRLEPQEMPEPVRAPAQPEDIETVEELYLTGLRIEQFHNPSLDPDPYWEEALRRDPGDVRVNTALGINYLKKAKFAEAEKLFRKALERLTFQYTSPKDGEPFYYLGAALKAQGKNKEAYDSFFKATWSMAWRAAAYYAVAEIDCLNGDLDMAMQNVDNSLEANALNVRALTLKAAVLRHKGKIKEALDALKVANEKSDPLDVRVMTEHVLADNDAEVGAALAETLRDFPFDGLETAAEYANCGFWQDSSDVLLKMIDAAPDKQKVSPLAYYYLGYFAEQMNQKDKASEYYKLGAQMSPEYVFPFQWEAINVLERVMEVSPKDAYAPYYLGNLLFDWQPERAVSLWEKSSSLEADYAIVYRNLAMVYQRQDKLPEAIASLEKAVNYAGSALHLFELDQLYEQTGADPAKRLAMFEKNENTAQQRDDALSREISLKVFMGKYDQAIEMLENRAFAVWEGGARFNVSDPWTDAHLLRGRTLLANRRFKEALADFQKSIEFPENLQEANLAAEGGNRTAEVAYWAGLAYEGMGDMENARKSWEQSASSSTSVTQARRGQTRGGTRGGSRGGRRGRSGGNAASNNSAQNFYQALSLMKLGRQAQAEEIFQTMLLTGNQMLEGTGQRNFFANFGAQQSSQSRLADAHYTIGLGNLGLNQRENASEQFRQVLEMTPDHLGAKTMLAQINDSK